MTASVEDKNETVDFIEYLKYHNSMTQTEISRRAGLKPSALSDAKKNRVSQDTIDKIRTTYAAEYAEYKQSRPSSADNNPKNDRELYIYYKAKYELLSEQYATLINTISNTLTSINDTVKSLSLGGNVGGQIKTQIRAADRVHR